MHQSVNRRLRFLVCGFALAGFGFTSVASAQADWRFAHPNPDIRISVNLQAVMKSPAVTEALKKAQTGPKEQAAQLQFVLGLLSTVDRISISARQNGKDSDVLALVTGSFDPQMIQSFFPSKGTSQIKQVGPHAILIGEGMSFTQATQRMEGAEARLSDELSQSDIWIAGSSSLMWSQPAASVPPALKAMRTFSVGLNMGEAPELNVVLSAADSAGSSQLLSALREMMAQATQAPQAARMLEQELQIQQDGTRVKLHFLMPAEMMRLAQAQAASGSFGEQLQPLMGMLGLAAGAGPAKTPKPPDNGGKIMIYGLDDGPHEVKVK